MRPPRRRGHPRAVRRRDAITTAAAGVAVLLLYAATPSAAGPAPTTVTASVPTDLPVEVFVETLDPRVVRPGKDVHVAGHVVNRSTVEMADVQVRLRVRTTPVISRSELAADTAPDTALGVPLPATTRPITGRLAPSASAGFDLTIPADDLHLGGFGVYPFAIEAIASNAATPDETVGQVSTFLPWVPAGSGFRPTRLSWVWPLADRPDRSATPIYPDDHLAGSVASGGRLDGLLSAVSAVTPGATPGSPTITAPPPAAKSNGKGSKKGEKKRPRRPPPDPDAQRPVPVAWAVDAALMQSIADMADGYLVRPADGGRSTPGIGRAAAATWLGRLRQTLPGTNNAAENHLVALPYADADINALVRNGMEDLALETVNRGRELTGSVLGVNPDPSLAVPADGYVGNRALATLVGTGVRTVVLRDAAVPLTTPLSYTPDAGAELRIGGRTVGALLYDSVLSNVAASADRGTLETAEAAAAAGAAVETSTPTPEPSNPVATHPVTARLVEQRFLAETALITAERPADDQAVLVVPPRRWDPDPSLAAALLADSGRVPWLSAVPLPELATDSAVPREDLTYPATAQDAELPTTYLTVGPTSVRELRDDLAVFRSILQPPAGPTAVALDYATLRTTSAAWRGDPTAGLDFRRRVAADLEAESRSVAISSGGRLITLASRRGAIPITVSNDLDQAVIVRLRLTATSSARLTAPVTAPRVVAAGHKVTSEVQAVVNQAGLFPVTAQLLTPDGRPYGPPVTLRLRSTAYGQLALGITLSALGVLLVAVIVRLVRRAQRARRRRAGATA